VKPREDRQKVVLRARMRVETSWHDVCIVNLSLHGVGIQTAQPPARGAYVEIRRGPNRIVARVAWSKGHRAGLRSQDAVFIQAFVREATAPSPVRKCCPDGIERRQSPRNSAHALEGSRRLGRALEYACFGLVACAVAVGAFGAVQQAFARPLEQIRLAFR
jgi:hypothetical protein